MSTPTADHAVGDDPPGQEPVPERARLKGWYEPVLEIPGLPEPTEDPLDTQECPQTVEEYIESMRPSGAFAEGLAQVEALFEGKSLEEKRLIGRGFYIDADRRPRTRHGLLRVVENSTA